MCTTRVYHSGGRNPLMLQEFLGDQGFLVGLVPRRGTYGKSRFVQRGPKYCLKAGETDAFCLGRPKAVRYNPGRFLG
jgi:hypothetical protein